MKIHDVVFVYHLQDKKLKIWHSRVHAHESNMYEFHYFVSGEGEFRNGDKTFKIVPNSLFLSYPEQIHEIIPKNDNNPITYYAILFEFVPELDAPFANLYDKKIKDSFPIILGTFARLKLEEIKNRYNSLNKYFRFSAETGLISFLFEIIGNIIEGTTLTKNVSNSIDLYVTKAMDIFQNGIYDNIRLKDVADSLKISEEYLIKIFKSKIGVTPIRFYQLLKLEVASSLLTTSLLSVKEISYKLCFSSQYHFSNSFKQFSGYSPTLYKHKFYSEHLENTGNSNE